MKLSDLTIEQWYARLEHRRAQQAQEITERRYWQYVDNEQPSVYLSRILKEQGDRFPELRVNWSALVVDAVDERLTVDGFRAETQDGSTADADDLISLWQDNDLDELAPEAHTCAMVTGRAYIMVGPGPAGVPLVTVEYPDQVAVEVDPATRRVVAGIKTWRSDELLTAPDMAAVYVPGREVLFQNGKPTGDVRPLPGAELLAAHPTSPMIPIVPMLNRPRRGVGRSELIEIMPLHDGVNQISTNMLAGIEHHSLPRRWAIGLAEKDFVDDDGKPIPAWKIATGAVWAIPGPSDDEPERGDRPQVEVGQFTAADLSGLHNSVKLLATLAGSLYGLPAHYIWQANDQPASADAIRSSEGRLVRRTERHQGWYGGPWERMCRVARAVMGKSPGDWNRLETIWRDASTPTLAARMDAASKALDSGLADLEQGRETAGFTESQRRRMRERAATATPVAQVEGIVSGLRQLDLTGRVPPGGAALPRS